MEDNECNDPNNYGTPVCNDLLLKKEEIEGDIFNQNENATPYLYPNVNDPNFNIKIAKKKEFNDTQYDGTIYNDEKYGVKEHAEMLSHADYSLRPHQTFVKNFMSSQTPYNSLLLYHGLGSGKTCSAIGVCEETRDYLKQLGISKRIIIVASPNVLDNFRLQLFDETKLKLIGGIWSSNSCIGNKLLNELNPTKLKGVPKERIISQIKNLINTSYLFLGYIEFSRYIEKMSSVNKINKEFDGRLIIIDEIHNIRMSDDNKANKKVAEKLMELVSSAVNMRLLLLSATPMYNNCREIVWLLNIMNINDRRATLNVDRIFELNGDFKEGGKELLIRKMRGYISFVRGENPYVFPFRVFPGQIFPNDQRFEYIKIMDDYPMVQMNGKPIQDNYKLKYLDLNVTPIGEYQLMGYHYYLNEMKKSKEYSSLQFFSLLLPLQALNIVYPQDGLIDFIPNPEEFYVQEENADNQPSMLEGEEDIEADTENNENEKENEYEEEEGEQESIRGGNNDNDTTVESGNFAGARQKKNINVGFALTGEDGLKRIMKITSDKTKYEYINKNNRIFTPENIGIYSSKIKNICQHIIASEGIVLIYSQYIDGGLIPMALALEELGFVKHNGDNTITTLLSPPNKNKPKSKQLRYSMITGDINISPNNVSVVKTLTNIENVNGDNIKVILLSKAGTEGIDLKFIRQIHIMEPWYNMSRVEQIIGRGVRDGSHKDIIFEKRNVEIYLHATKLPYPNIETADLYVYRNAEQKAIQIGEITRLMKINSVDCILNRSQNNFTQDNFTNVVTQELSCGKIINDFKVGDTDFSSYCDYKTCKYDIETVIDDIDLNTYNEKFMSVNSDNIIRIIKRLFKERHFYKKTFLIQEITRVKMFPTEQIDMALTKLIEEKENIIDTYFRNGVIVNVGEYYFFQPLELTNTQISVFERMVPLLVKTKKIPLNVSKRIVLNADIVLENAYIKNGVSILNALSKKYATTLKYASNDEIISRGEADYYKFCGRALRELVSKELIDIQKINDLIIEHLVDMLVYQDKVDLINYFYNIQHDDSENTIEIRVFTYLRNSVISYKNKIFIVLFDGPTKKILMYQDNIWSDADAFDADQIDNKSIRNSREYNSLVGFIDYEKTENAMVFKTKDMSNSRSSGARCDQSNKQSKLKNLSIILDNQPIFTTENTKTTNQQELCAYQEFILRYKNGLGNEKVYFLSFEQYKLSKITK